MHTIKINSKGKKSDLQTEEEQVRQAFDLLCVFRLVESEELNFSLEHFKK